MEWLCNNHHLLEVEHNMAFRAATAIGKRVAYYMSYQGFQSALAHLNNEHPFKLPYEPPENTLTRFRRVFQHRFVLD